MKALGIRVFRYALAAAIFYAAGAMIPYSLSEAFAQGSKERWDKTVAAAKKEGRVVVFGFVGQDLRQGIVDGFRKAFPEIDIEYTGGRENELVTRIMSERRGGVYGVDVIFSGASVAHLHLMPANALEPMPPALIMPEVADLKYWRDGRHRFTDKEGKWDLAFIEQTGAPIAYDPRHKAEEVDELTKLFDPKFKGRIVVNDPRVPGAGDAFFRWLWRIMEKEKAIDIYKKLRAQTGAIDRDQRRQLEWVAQGKFSVLLGPSNGTMQQLLKAGVKIGALDEFKDVGNWLASGFGTLMRLNKAPNPNAQIVFINWLLSRDGQTAYSRAVNALSRRNDVPTAHLPSWLVPKPGVKYWPSDLQGNTDKTEEEGKLINELFS
jgi:iron(III) transport system substrate-binding protein